MFTKLRAWVDSITNDNRPATVAGKDLMLSCYLSMIEVRVSRAELVIKDDPASQRINNLLQDIKRQLENIKTTPAMTDPSSYPVWIEAQRLERMLALVEPAEYLWIEIQSSLAELEDEKSNAVPRLKAAADIAHTSCFTQDNNATPTLKAGGEDILRSLLMEILEDLHWTSERKHYSRPIRKSATNRIVAVGLIAFFFFLLPYLFLHASVHFGKVNPLYSWSHIPLYTALTTGFLGALFSRLLYLQMNWDALSVGGLKGAAEYSSIILRACVGVAAGLLVFFFLESGVVKGPLIPDYTKIALEDYGKDSGSLHIIIPNKDLALLVVWSFLAGFSERLVPSILRDTENSLTKIESPK
jgi:hypothetical protein